MSEVTPFGSSRSVALSLRALGAGLLLTSLLAVGCTTVEDHYRNGWESSPEIQALWPELDDYLVYMRLVVDDPAAAAAMLKPRFMARMANFQPTAAQQKQIRAAANTKLTPAQQKQVQASMGLAGPALKPVDLAEVFRDLPAPAQPIAVADQSLADELFRWGEKNVRAFYVTAGTPQAADSYPRQQEFSACSWGALRLGELYSQLKPRRAEQVFRLLWRRAQRAVEQVNPTMRRASAQILVRAMAIGYYQSTQQVGKLVPYYKAQAKLGAAQRAAAVRFRANAGLAGYAYTIGQTEAFDHYADLALGLAAEALKGTGTMKFTITPQMRQTLKPYQIAELEALVKQGSKGRTDYQLFPDLGILARQLGDRQRVAPMRSFAKAALGSDSLSGRLCYQMALALGAMGEIESAQALAAKAPLAYLEQSSLGSGGGKLARTHGEYLKLRAKGEAKLVPLLLSHYGGQEANPWPELARISGELWEAELHLQRDQKRFRDMYQRREQALVVGWSERRAAFALPLSAKRIRQEAKPFLLDGLFEASPLIKTVEEEDPDLAIALYLVGVTAQEGKREGISIQDRTKLFDSLKNRTLYRGLLRALARRGKAGDAERAWAISELSRARQLKELLASDTSRQVASLDHPLELAKRLRAGLAPDQALVGYHLLPEHLLVLTLSRAKSSATLVPLDSRAFAARVSALHEALANPASKDVGSRLLSIGSVLLEPVSSLLQGKRRLFVLPDGVLHTLPFDVLPGRNGKPLLESVSVTVLPSAEGLLRAPRKASAEARLFALADPVYPQQPATLGAASLEIAQATQRGAKGIPALPETREEVSAIAELFARKTVLLGGEARESVVKSTDLSAYSHVHFATHGVLAYELPNVTEPALILSGESGEDAFLTASEASGLRLNADVCVLSACNTGSGKVLNGEGVLGLSRAFLLAGARTVVVSLWPVASEATKDLMIRFYTHVKAGKPKAEALRLAKLDMARRVTTGGGTRGFGGVVSGTPTTPVNKAGDGRHPFFWAPFVLVGGE